MTPQTPEIHLWQEALPYWTVSFRFSSAPRVFTKVMVVFIARLTVQVSTYTRILNNILIRAPSQAEAHKLWQIEQLPAISLRDYIVLNIWMVYVSLWAMDCMHSTRGGLPLLLWKIKQEGMIRASCSGYNTSKEIPLPGMLTCMSLVLWFSRDQ